ncbi:unnamed protein product [Porites evermanni]|uniref:EGF-like domain-containing protein n=1 Tax=Porites evermanni TaxID=104178 RepID=A0ABN8S5H8_9CNID|nr:unnamed protein product [Porites evermanni]
MLQGHVIRTEKVANEGSCRVRCFLEPSCVSINVGPAGDQGQRTCELKNFTDESPSQTGLQEATGHIHYSAENICHSNPCPGENFICQVGFSAKRYRCVCRDGFKGENCDEEINECSLDKGCGVNLSTVSEYPPTVSSASKALDTSTASSSATQPADVSSSEATVIPTAVSTALPASTCQPPPLGG